MGIQEPSGHSPPYEDTADNRLVDRDPLTPPLFGLAGHPASIRLREDLLSSIEIQDDKIGPPLPDFRDWDSCEELPALVIDQGQEGFGGQRDGPPRFEG